MNFDKIKEAVLPAAEESLAQILESSREDVSEAAERVVEVGLRAALEGDPMAISVMQDQLRALVNVTTIRANREALNLAAKIVSLIVVTAADAARAALL